MIEENIKVIIPRNYGWIEKRLSEKEMNYLWECIDKHQESLKESLAGNIHESYELIDDNDWFFYNTIQPLCSLYAEVFENVGKRIPVNQTHPYILQPFWVNYQKQNEFNPSHNHDGVYSFVIWMKIPTRHLDQIKNPISLNSNSDCISAFQFQYTNLLGEIKFHQYEMNPEIEGTLIFFPAKLHHQVYPFFNCQEDRISISGNITLDSSKVHESD